jgi:heme oxygenase (biliverdin-producing, ferredoxin)
VIDSNEIIRVTMNRRKSIHASAARPDLAQSGLSERLREATRSLHVQAERSGIIGELLRGGGSRKSYALLLRNLVPAYRRMEQGLDRHTNSPSVGSLARRELYRAPALESDLDELAGTGWRETLALLPAGERYARRVEAASEGDGVRLVAHAYLRYLGDLSGGQIMKRLLAKSLGLDAAMLTFYDFPGIPDVAAFKTEFRSSLDEAVIESTDIADVIDEAEAGFRLTIEVSEAVLSTAVTV